MTVPPPPGWPQPPYDMPPGALLDHLDRHGWTLYPQHLDRHANRLIVEELVRAQATRRLAVRHVRDEHGRDALLVCDRAVWACPEGD